MGEHCKARLESDNVLECSAAASFSSCENVNKENFSCENVNKKSFSCENVNKEMGNSDGLWADWEEIFLRLDQQDGIHDGRILRSSLLSWLETLSLQDTVKLEMMQGVGRGKVSNMVAMLDPDKDGYVSKQEFLNLVRRNEQHLERIEKSPLLRYLRVAAFADQYRWSPPPLFSICLSILLLLVFTHQTVKQSVDGGEVLAYPVCSPLAIHPLYARQPWRLLTYSLAHFGIEHLLVNILLLLLVGFPLEMTHGSCRVALVFIPGVLVASLLYSVSKPCGSLVGCSAGVYALTTSHLATIALNWREDSLVLRQRMRDKMTTAPTYGIMVRICRLLVVGGILLMDVFTTLLTPDSNTSYEAHLTGSLVGLLVGMVVLRNRRVEHWETWVKAGACVSVLFLLLLLAVLHIVEEVRVKEREVECMLERKSVCLCQSFVQISCNS